MKVPGEYQSVQPQAATANRAQKRPTSSKHPVPVVNLSGTVTICAPPAGEFWRIDHLAAMNFDGSTADTCVFFMTEPGGSLNNVSRIGKYTIATDDAVRLEDIIGTIVRGGMEIRAYSNLDTINVYGGVTRFFQGEFSD